jgi:hypothetical protein
MPRDLEHPMEQFVGNGTLGEESNHSTPADDLSKFHSARS